MDGQYYYVDATWDDPAFADNGDTNQCVEYTFFGITTEELNRNHQIIDWLGGMARMHGDPGQLLRAGGPAVQRRRYRRVHRGAPERHRVRIPGLQCQVLQRVLDTAVHAMEVSNLTALATLSYIRHDDLGVITVLIN